MPTSHFCRSAACGIPELAVWTSEPHLLERCLDNLGLTPASWWDRDKSYLCYNEKDANADTLNRKMRDLVDAPGRFKAVVFNLQDRLLQKGMSSLQEIMLAYVKEVALPHLRRIAAQDKTAVVITADHGFTWYNTQYVIDDIKTELAQDGKCSSTTAAWNTRHTSRTSVGPADVKRIGPVADYGLPIQP